MQIQIIEKILECIHEKKGLEPVIIDFKDFPNFLFSHFIICHGTSAPHVDTLVEFIDNTLRSKFKIRSYHVEGLRNKEWVLIDYGDVIVHIFQGTARSFYNLEELWADACIYKYETQT